jgi:hypothetical protein
MMLDRRSLLASMLMSMEGFVRPEAVVLPESALIPDKNLISPAPNQFTHELMVEQPYYYASAQEGVPPDGRLPAGTNVVLLVYDGGERCRVVDGRGLYVEIEYAALKRL